MKDIEFLENQLEGERDHSAFLEKLLSIHCGKDWNKLTKSKVMKRFSQRHAWWEECRHRWVAEFYGESWSHFISHDFRHMWE